MARALRRRERDGRTFRHYAAAPFTFDRDYAYDEYATGVGKPVGLWFSVLGEYGWPEWCRDEGYALHRLGVEYAVHLTDSARLLVIDTLESLRDFDRRMSPAPRYGLEGHASRLDLDWSPVMGLYDGLVIAPYQGHARFDLLWYYGWDCASGVVWNLDAVKDLVPVS